MVCGVLGGGARVRAQGTAEVRTANGAARTVRVTAQIVAIDPADRVLTLQDERGASTTVEVPPDIKGFAALKVGDRVDVDYYEGIAMQLLPPGSKPTRTDRQLRSATAGGVNVGHEVTASAEIISVDQAENDVTFKGARGVRTVHVDDPHLQRMVATLKPGQVVQVTYRQATAASIRPHGQ